VTVVTSAFVRPGEERIMRSVSEQEQEAVMDVLRRNEGRLKALQGAHYVDVGYRFVDGKATDELAIRVHVSEKVPETALRAAQVAPQEIEGIRVDVIQSNPELQENPRDARFDPVVAGTAVANTRFDSFGTLGLVVIDAESSQPMGLSNHHVFVGEEELGQEGDTIVQPATTNEEDVIGTLARWSKDLDCAVCTLNESRVISNEIVDYPDGATAIEEPLIGTPVTKSGRTTGTTFGVIDGVSADEFTIVPDTGHPAPSGEISASGDSGSVWLRLADSAALGLHYAGEREPDPNAERAWAKRMARVAEELKFKLRTPSDAPGDPPSPVQLA
jgi:hypothetical protein